MITNIQTMNSFIHQTIELIKIKVNKNYYLIYIFGFLVVITAIILTIYVLPTNGFHMVTVLFLQLPLIFIMLASCILYYKKGEHKMFFYSFLLFLIIFMFLFLAYSLGKYGIFIF
jgi:hypothetical protein